MIIKLDSLNEKALNFSRDTETISVC